LSRDCDTMENMTNTCQECKKETDNPKFCSKRCANRYNNRLHPRNYQAVRVGRERKARR
jgi:hypothetical protein